MTSRENIAAENADKSLFLWCLHPKEFTEIKHLHSYISIYYQV